MSQHSPDTPQTPLLGNGTLRSFGIVPYLGRLLFLQVVRSMLHTSYNPWSRWPDSQKTGWDCHGFCVWRRQILLPSTFLEPLLKDPLRRLRNRPTGCSRTTPSTSRKPSLSGHPCALPHLQGSSGHCRHCFAEAPIRIPRGQADCFTV